jgi:cephalosporin hydroxylase
VSEITRFRAEVENNIARLKHDGDLRRLSNSWIQAIAPYKYSYNFTWLGRPVIQLPQDLMAMQEIIWMTRPDLIIETGIAHGGSLIFHASMLELIGGNGLVLGIDIDIRAHNRVEIEGHPLAKRIAMFEGSSIDDKIVHQVRDLARGRQRVLVVLDSNHTHDHVLEELRLYSPLVRRGSYLVVLDTVIEDMPADAFPDRPWGKGNNPKTAVHEFLKTNRRFEIDRDIDAKLLVTVAPDGYLKCVGDEA